MSNFRKISSLQGVLAIASLVTFSVCSGAMAQPNSCLDVLPGEILDIIESEYANWEIFSNDDLISDHQIMWDIYHGKDKCAGIVEDVFSPPLDETFAILLIRSNQERKESQILFFVFEDNSWNHSVVLRKSNISSYPVIFMGDPGQYSDFYDRRQSTDTNFSTLIYEHMESSAIVFIYANGTIIERLVSD